MPAARGQTPTIIPATVPRLCSTLDGMVKIPAGVHIQCGPQQSVPMPSACGTCTGMFGNGVRMPGTEGPTLSMVLWVWIRSLSEARTRFGSAGAARGSARPGSAAPLSATGTTLAVALGAGASAFACPPVR